MAVRRINYINRKRISQKDVEVYVYPSDNGISAFDVNLNISKYNLPEEAHLYVEAYRQTSWMRFRFGNVGDIKMPSNRQLSEFNVPEVIRFRVKVTSKTDPKGVLLAEADQIQPKFPEEEADERFSLLPVRPDEDLRDQIYKLNMDDRPILLINPKVGDWRSVARNPLFISLVYPNLLREILTRIFYVEEYFDIDLMSDWRSQWIYFATKLPGTSDPPAETQRDKIEDWINEVVSAFCRKFSIQKKFMNHWANGD
jgi:hypothetical protein